VMCCSSVSIAFVVVVAVDVVLVCSFFVCLFVDESEQGSKNNR